MRLGQLARKVSVRPADIVSFLSARGNPIEEGANTRVESNLVKMVIAHFAPDLDENELEISVHMPEPETDDLAGFPEQPINEEQVEKEIELPKEEIVEPISSEENSAESPQTEQPIEVIKAPKIELQGLKVIGKIELPQPKKKEPLAPTDESGIPQAEVAPPSEASEKKKKRDDRKPRPGENRRSEARPRRNPIELQREREAREAEERRKEEAQREKEKRTQYYLQKVRPSGPSRAVRLIDEPVSEMKDEAPDEPKTLWGKFVKWLTT
jgi:hypothetical protein